MCERNAKLVGVTGIITLNNSRINMPFHAELSIF
jgi:hypothetical protein